MIELSTERKAPTAEMETLESDEEPMPDEPRKVSSASNSKAKDITQETQINHKEKSSEKPRKRSSLSGKMVLCRVTMLDASTFEVEVDKAALGRVLLDKVCAHLNIIETDYFGLTFVGARDVKFWLSSDKKIAKQLKGGCRWVFEFAIKFYPPEPQMLHEDMARYQLCLQLRVDLYNGKLPCSFVTHGILGAYTVQAELGDYDPVQDGPGSGYLKDFDFAPKQAQDLFDKIAELHKTHKGQTPEEAELNFLENSKKLAMYGVDLHKATDSEGININLGVCASGLMIYRDKLRINRFVWPKILKLQYKRNNFYIKIRPDSGETSENNICFKLENHKMAKRLWKTCVEHHAFFRLKEADQQTASTLFPRFNSRFRYSGRTQKQLKDRQDLIDKPKEVFERTHWKNKQPNPDGPNRLYEDGQDPDHPLDEKDRLDQKLGDQDAHMNAGTGPPPYKENDTLGKSYADRPAGMPGDISEDRTDLENDKQATLEGVGPGGDAAGLAEGGSVTPGDKKGKKSKEDREREKREKEEEKRRKKEEEKDRRRLEKLERESKKRKDADKSTTEDITDKMGDTTATELAPGELPGDSAALQQAGLAENLPEWPYGKEGSIDRKMQFIPISVPETEVRDRNGVADDNTMPFFDPASPVENDDEGTLGKKVPPPVASKPSKHVDGNMSEEDRRLYVDGEDGLLQADLPPTVATERVKYSTNLEDKPISTTNFPIVKTETRTVTYEKDGIPVETEDCILISSQSHSTRTQTFETTTYKTEIDGKVETRMEKKIIISEDGDDIDHDELLAEAIRSVTEMNQDLSVERIECMRQLENVEN